MRSTQTDPQYRIARVPAGPDHQRAADVDRDGTIDHLRANAAAGRLDVDELDRRTDAALKAVTLGDLRALVADLPQPEPARRPRPRPRLASPLSSPVGVFLAVSVMLVAIWALTGADYFWPIWPILGWGLCAVPHRGRGSCGSRARPGVHSSAH